MFNETQKHHVAERLTTELDGATEDQIVKVGDLVQHVAALNPSNDVEYLLGVIDPETNADEMVVKAAHICLAELAVNN